QYAAIEFLLPCGPRGEQLLAARLELAVQPGYEFERLLSEDLGKLAAGGGEHFDFVGDRDGHLGSSKNRPILCWLAAPPQDFLGSYVDQSQLLRDPLFRIVKKRL